MIYELNFGKIKLKADSFGAQLKSVKFNGKERLWQNDNGSWGESAPVLFPTASFYRVIVDGKDYNMPFHGFAKKMEFALKEKTENKLVFELKENDFSLTYYPFEFIFKVSFEIIEDVLYIDYTTTNPSSKKSLYYVGGGHESYALDKNVGEYEVEFEKEEKFDCLMGKKNGRIGKKPKKFGKGKVFALPEDFLSWTSIIFKDIKSDYLILREKSGKKVAQVSLKDFPVLLFWHPHDTNMICVEPWLNIPDDEEDYFNELKDKKGIIKLNPKESKSFKRYIKYY